MIFGGLLAGGSGSRMETAKMPKQFIRIAGIPIFIRSLNAFLSIDNIEKIVISMNNEWSEEYIKLIREFDIDESRIILTSGGDSRFGSLINVSRKVLEISDCLDPIMISHDCARVFVSERILRDNITMIEEYDMVTTSIPTIDTIIQCNDDYCCSSVPDRTKLWADQGPQTFHIKTFLKYVSMIPLIELPDYIEAVKLYLKYGGNIGVVKGERTNFKITNDIDLQYAEFLIQEGFVK
jgi:2-C-methyl-D-erythritol 4-phosphate cytidylyltransferase